MEHVRRLSCLDADCYRNLQPKPSTVYIRLDLVSLRKAFSMHTY